MMSSTDEEDLPPDWRTEFDHPTASSSSSGFLDSDDDFLAGSASKSSSSPWILPQVNAEEPNQSASTITPLRARTQTTISSRETGVRHLVHPFDYSSEESTHRSIFGSDNPNALPASPIKSRTMSSRQSVSSTTLNKSEVITILNKGEKVLPHIGLLMAMVREFYGISLDVRQYIATAVSPQFLTYADSKNVTEFLLNNAVNNAYNEYINENFSDNITAISSVVEGGCKPPSLLSFFGRVFHQDDGKDQAEAFRSEYSKQSSFQSKLQCLFQHLIFGEGGHLDTSFKTLLLKHLNKEFELNVQVYKKSVKPKVVAQALALFDIKKPACRGGIEFGF